MTPDTTTITADEIADMADDIVKAALAQLREPFTGDAVGKLPRITCRNCRETRGSKCCGDHSRRECQVCGNYMTTAHMHLDYVGHAEVTDRLLTVDPYWNWEPMARDVDPSLLAACMGDAALVRQIIECSPPKFERAANGQPIGMWIRLTVCGVPRIGFGSVEVGKTDPEKQLISDALRNAAMRFGVALTLWSKGRLESEVDIETDNQAPARQGNQADAPRRDAPAIGEGQEDTRPLWQQFGYADADEYQATYESLQDIIRAIAPDQKAPVRAWLIEHGYTMPDPNGEPGAVMARQLPVRRGHVPEYSTLLKAARDASSRAVVGLPAPSGSTDPVASSPETAGNGEVGDQEPTGGADAVGELPASIDSAALDEIIADVKLMSVADLTAELGKRSLPKTGNKAALGQRLTVAVAHEWVTTHSPV